MKLKFSGLCVSVLWLLLLDTCGQVNWELSDPKQSKEVREKWLRETRDFLERAEEFTVFSLDPVPWNWKPKKEQKRTPKSEFHGYIELGKIHLPRSAERTNLVAAFIEGIANGRGYSACFEPRHGLRAIQGTNTVELVICYSCKQVYSYSNSRTNRIFHTTARPVHEFTVLLKKAKIPLAK